MVKLTNYEKTALDAARGKGWFNPVNDHWSWHSILDGRHSVRRPYFVAERLFKKGYFDRRLVGTYLACHFEYRIKEEELNGRHNIQNSM